MRLTQGKNRRSAGPVLLLVLALLFVINPLSAAEGRSAAPGVAAAPQQGSPVVIAFSKDAYWYEPGDSAQLRVTLDNTSRQAIRGVSVRVRIHTPNTTRADLDASFEGKPKKSYRQTETFGPMTLETGNNRFDFRVDLAVSRYSNGVYPVTLEVLRSGEMISSIISELVVMSLASIDEPVPLKLSWVFDTLELPHRDPEGNFKGDELALECDPSGRNPGWYPTLLNEMEKWQQLSFGVCLSPMLLEDIQIMSGGYTVRRGEKVEKIGSASKESGNASEVLSGFKRLSQSPRYQLITEPYASPDLETLIYLKWRNDAAQQIDRGHKLLEETLDTALSKEFSCPPGLNVNSRVIKELGSDLGQFLVLSPALLERSREGRRLLRGQTLSSPVLIEGAQDDRRELALFADGRMQELLDRLGESGDPHGVAQSVLAELTNLYLERPAMQRACVVVAPGSWHPPKDVLDEVLRALDGAPWLKTTTLAESMMTVTPLGETPLEIPEPEMQTQTREYFLQVGRARDKFKAYHEIVFTGNPFLVPLQRNIYVAESAVWNLWDRRVEGLGYSGFVTTTVDGELDKVDMPAVGSITLTSTDAKIPLSVVNATDYRIKAVLKCASNGLTFPSGAEQEVLLEPKENLLEIPVKVKNKGRVRFSARLEADQFILGELDFGVLTSRFNTFAILVVTGLLALIGAVWAASIISRRKVGKHKKRQLEEPGKEQGRGAEA